MGDPIKAFHPVHLFPEGITLAIKQQGMEGSDFLLRLLYRCRECCLVFAFSNKYLKNNDHQFEVLSSTFSLVYLCFLLCIAQ